MRSIRVTLAAAIAFLLQWPSTPRQAAEPAGAVPVGMKDGRDFVPPASTCRSGLSAPDCVF
jgi:hypothetical protein